MAFHIFKGREKGGEKKKRARKKNPFKFNHGSQVDLCSIKGKKILEHNTKTVICMI